MKTVEFKLDLTQEQEKTIDSWLSALKPIWNYGLSLYEEDQQRRWRDKYEITAPLGLCLKWNSKTKKPVGVGVLETKKGYKYCPLRTKHIIPDTKKAINQAYRFYEQDWVLAVCSRARIALIRNTLKDAWNSYQKGIRRRPRFKGKLDKIVSFSNNSSAKDCKIKNNKIRLAALGWVKAKGLSDRWDSSLELKQYRVIKQASGYYLQLVGELPNTDYGLPSDKAIGVDVGSSKVWTDTMGRQIEPKRYFRKKQKQLKRLQRKKARQKNGSSNQKKTKQRIAKVHEKIARQRRGFNHQLSTKIVKEYGAIAVEDINFANLTRTPKAKLREDGKGYQENGRKRKAGLNKSLLDHGLGQLRDMIEAKSKSSDREFIKVKAAYTSQECSQCGHTSAENRSKKPMTKFLCVSCEHADHADRNAAINILNRGLKKFDRKYRIYPCLEGKVTPDSIGDVPIGDAERLTSKQMKQEAIHNSTLGQANPAISPNRGARPNSDQNQKLNIQSSNSDVAKDSHRKRLKRTRANPQSHIQLTIWDLPAS